MHDAGGVRLREAVRELAGEIEEALRGQRASVQNPPQRGAFGELHHDVAPALALADVVNMDDVGVGECRSGAGLLLEAAYPLGVGRELGSEHFDRDLAAELEIARAEDLPHASAAE